MISPGVIELKEVTSHIQLQASSQGQSNFRVLEEQVLIACSQGKGFKYGPFGAEAHTFGIIVGMKRIDRQLQPIVGREFDWQTQPHPKDHGQGIGIGINFPRQAAVIAVLGWVVIVSYSQVSA